MCERRGADVKEEFSSCATAEQHVVLAKPVPSAVVDAVVQRVAQEAHYGSMASTSTLGGAPGHLVVVMK
eukprot:CAMPEP_0115695270 /NCGR_PEP_ID=MMETSP0272-20121206/64677_1 /TAXON_ID=71861 /ORGANISM="Scrippsiella trochoidea, Strain CCMP3099" /LENGTH=68 /DNA_ID=CAMNT_0003135459 /DNA_START=94 /DNA_END=301 /DNA_ORIENTATION=-